VDEIAGAVFHHQNCKCSSYSVEPPTLFSYSSKLQSSNTGSKKGGMMGKVVHYFNCKNIKPWLMQSWKNVKTIISTKYNGVDLTKFPCVNLFKEVCVHYMSKSQK
jgi:hypothetical protein